VILGASFDTPTENLAFAEAQGFPYQLLSDTTKEVGTAYDVKKGADEQWADFPRRRTILIDPQGNVHKVYDVKDVATNASEVLTDIAAATN
jgi:thioredoxin-dependent peroxiredoxin